MNVKESNALTDLMSGLRKNIYDTVNFKYHFSTRLRSTFDTYNIDMRCEPMGGFFITCEGRKIGDMESLYGIINNIMVESIRAASAEIKYQLPDDFASLSFGIFDLNKISSDTIIIRI